MNITLRPRHANESDDTPRLQEALDTANCREVSVRITPLTISGVKVPRGMRVRLEGPIQPNHRMAFPQTHGRWWG